MGRIPSLDVSQHEDHDDDYIDDYLTFPPTIHKKIFLLISPSPAACPPRAERFEGLSNEQWGRSLVIGVFATENFPFVTYIWIMPRYCKFELL
ncbi:hypothetical protein JTE90_003142 [Oedothorax gibbosus]|uniref:Uncharacterized protein n=1 Tax=Oedothorax gibbosus TaxID=931172 RepID=A0AAV6VGB1_9ARAC|nr:hypothetical protein JTE90_003142 [Oedothorax gibbosus]